VLWVITFLIKVIIFYYAAVKGLSEILEFKRHDSLVLPMAVIIAFLTMTAFSGPTDYTTFLITLYPLIAIPVVFGIPLLFLLAKVMGPGLKE